MDMGEGFESRENPKQEHWRKETQGRNSLMPPLLQNATVSELRMGWLVSSRGNELTFTDREVYSSNSVTDREVYACNTAELCGRHTRLRIVTSGHSTQISKIVETYQYRTRI